MPERWAPSDVEGGMEPDRFGGWVKFSAYEQLEDERDKLRQLAWAAEAKLDEVEEEVQLWKKMWVERGEELRVKLAEAEDKLHEEEVAHGSALHREDRLKDELAEVEGERDDAIAHDRQPYPTAWAYEQTCRVEREQRDRAEAAEAKLKEESQRIILWRKDCERLEADLEAAEEPKGEERCERCGGTGWVYFFGRRKPCPDCQPDTDAPSKTETTEERQRHAMYDALKAFEREDVDKLSLGLVILRGQLADYEPYKRYIAACKGSGLEGSG